MPRGGNEDIYEHDLGCPIGMEPWYPSCLKCPLPICQLELIEDKPRKRAKKRLTKAPDKQ